MPQAKECNHLSSGKGAKYALPQASRRSQPHPYLDLSLVRLILDFWPQTEREHICGVLRFVSVTRTNQQCPMSSRGLQAYPLRLPIPVPSHLLLPQPCPNPAFTICLRRQWADWKSPQGSHELEVKEWTSLSTAEMKHNPCKETEIKKK